MARHGPHVAPPSAHVRWPSHGSTLTSHVAGLRGEDQFSDVILSCGRRQYPAHRAVLAGSSSLLKNLLLDRAASSHQTSCVIILDGFVGEHIQALLQYMYLGYIYVKFEDLAAFCKTAKLFGLRDFPCLEVVETGKVNAKDVTESVGQTNVQPQTTVPFNTKNTISSSSMRIKKESLPLNLIGSSKHRQKSELKPHRLADSTPVKLDVSLSREEYSSSQLAVNDRHDIRLLTATTATVPAIAPRATFATTAVPATTPTTLPATVLERIPPTISATIPVTVRQQTLPDSTVGSENNRKRRGSATERLVRRSLQESITGNSYIHLKKYLCEHKDRPASTPNFSTDDNRIENCKSEETLFTCSDSDLHGGFVHSSSIPYKPLDLRVNSPIEVDLTEEAHNMVSGEIFAEQSFSLNSDRHQKKNGIPKFADMKKCMGTLTPTKSRISGAYSGETSRTAFFDTDTSLFQTTVDTYINHSSNTTEDPVLLKITGKQRKRVRGLKCWEYLQLLLRNPKTNPSLICWEDKEAGVFKLVKPDQVAWRWGKRNGKKPLGSLTYENFARSLRYHYGRGALTPVSERAFVYRFGPMAQERASD